MCKNSDFFPRPQKPKRRRGGEQLFSAPRRRRGGGERANDTAIAIPAFFSSIIAEQCHISPYLRLSVAIRGNYVKVPPSPHASQRDFLSYIRPTLHSLCPTCSWTWVGLTLILVSHHLAQPLLPNFHQPRQDWADSGTLKIQVNPTQSTSTWDAL